MKLRKQQKTAHKTSPTVFENFLSVREIIAINYRIENRAVTKVDLIFEVYFI